MKLILSTIGLIGIAWLTLFLLTRPTNDRNWINDQAVLAYAEIDGNQVHIKNIRNFSYTSTTDYTPAYYDKTFDVNKLQAAYFIVEPFSNWEGAAHTFMSFGFEGDEFLAISIEIRKEQGEQFSAVKGVLRQYEMMYVIADEKDVVKLRSNYRKDNVYIYPVKTSLDKIQDMFLEMLKRANQLKAQPEFYNTLINSCTTNIVKHVNTLSPKTVPSWSYKVLFPGYSDQLAYDLGLIDTDLPFEKIRDYFRINDRAMKYADSPDFSVKIRQ
jgi:hypothetical protein